MGLYAFESIEKAEPVDGHESFIRVVKYPGIETRTTFVEVAIEEIRTNCFCCSCGDREGSDPACRNHGFAAERPCELHGMPGSPWGDEVPELEGQMPKSVQAHRARNGE